jgi:hypothetical protein
MKLDISAYQPGNTVTLRVFANLSDTRAASVTTNIYGVTNTSWSETTLTFNNRPTSGSTVLGTLVVSGTTGQWYQVDLSAYVQAQQAAGQTTIAIALKGAADTLPYATFRSRQSSTNKPELVITP